MRSILSDVLPHSHFSRDDAAASLVGERLRAEDADLEIREVALALGALVKLLDETRNI